MSSFISPVRPVETGVPWGWNPAATFQASFIAAQENQRAQEQFQMKAELDRILFPVKKAQAEFTLKELAYESENMAGKYKLMGEVMDAKRRILRSGGGSGASSNVAGNVGSSNQAPDSSQEKTGYSNRLLQGRSANQFILGSNIQPLDENE